MAYVAGMDEIMITQQAATQPVVIWVPGGYWELTPMVACAACIGLLVTGMALPTAGEAAARLGVYACRWMIKWMALQPVATLFGYAYTLLEWLPGGLGRKKDVRNVAVQSQCTYTSVRGTLDVPVSNPRHAGHRNFEGEVWAEPCRQV